MAVSTPFGRAVAVGASALLPDTRWPIMAEPSVGEIVRRYRRLRRLTQQHLGEAIGSDKSYIGKLETSPSQEPSLEVLRRLAKALEIPTSILTAPLGYVPIEEMDSPDKLAAAEAELEADRKLPTDLRDLALSAIRMARKARTEHAG